MSIAHDTRIDPAPRRRSRAALAVVALVVCATALAAIVAFRRGVATANRAQCARYLQSLGQAMLLYTNENRGRWPDSFATLMRNEDLVPEIFVSPDDGRAARAADAAHFDESDPAQCSFVYAGDSRAPIMSDMTAESVLAFDRPEVHGDAGVHVLFADGHVEFVAFAPAGRRPAWWAAFEASRARRDRPFVLPAEAITPAVR